MADALGVGMGQGLAMLVLALPVAWRLLRGDWKALLSEHRATVAMLLLAQANAALSIGFLVRWLVLA